MATQKKTNDIHAWLEWCKEQEACEDAVEWLSEQSDAASAWRECERGDWMLWILGRLDPDRKRLVLCACECARLTLPHVEEGEERPRIAIETAESWARGEGATLKKVRSAAHAAYAAYAAAYAADAADAAYAADAAADAAYADAAYAAAFAAASHQTHKQCADITRKYFPTVPELGGV